MPFPSIADRPHSPNHAEVIQQLHDFSKTLKRPVKTSTMDANTPPSEWRLIIPSLLIKEELSFRTRMNWDEEIDVVVQELLQLCKSGVGHFGGSGWDELRLVVAMMIDVGGGGGGGGERSDPLGKVLAGFPARSLVNGYGPIEGSVAFVVVLS
nr:hypothetical protein [Tanacetum cinerariifolium]